MITFGGIYTKFSPAYLRHLVQCLKQCFLVIACNKDNFSTAEIHECLHVLSFSTSLFWNKGKSMGQKFENDHPPLIQIKLCTPFWTRSYGIHLEKGNSFILEQIRIIVFCPFDHYCTINKDVIIVYGIWEAIFPTSYVWATFQ